MTHKGIAIFLLLWLAAVGLILTKCTPAGAHDAPATAANPQGWQYPFSCCSGYDCRPLPEGRVKIDRNGYTVPNGEVIGFTDKRVKPSQDGEYHWCTHGGSDTGGTICLFTPAGGV